jgi:hypothetical protein
MMNPNTRRLAEIRVYGSALIDAVAVMLSDYERKRLADALIKAELYLNTTRVMRNESCIQIIRVDKA